MYKLFTYMIYEWFVTCTYMYYETWKKFERSLNSCVCMYVQVRVVHVLCVTMNAVLPLYPYVDYTLRRHCMWWNVLLVMLNCE